LARKAYKILISGGGTGGHVFPAIAIGQALSRLDANVELLFVGAKGRMEMEQVPKAGFAIEGLWISGFQRRMTWGNMLFPIKLATSMAKAWQLVRRFAPDVVVGVGGYASGPVLEVATRKGLPTLIQEQNSYPGATNRLLAARVDRICVAWPGMERWFPAEKLVYTGNPVRRQIVAAADRRAEGRAYFGLAPDKPTILVVGGSLGARTLNEALIAAYERIAAHKQVQWLWQTGKLYAQVCLTSATAALPQVVAQPFLDCMELAWAAADVVICRAGALTLSELCVAGKAGVLVPSPNVVADHQTHNARTLVEAGAALMVPDAQAVRAVAQALALIDDAPRRTQLAERARQLAKPHADRHIAREVLALAAKKEVTYA